MDLDAALEARKHQSLFNVVDMATGWKIDLIIRKSRPFCERAASRERNKTTNNEPFPNSNKQASADDKQQRERGRVRKPYLLSALASAFAPRISARNGWAAAGTSTLPNSKARVVTLGPYIARRESLS